MMKHRFTFVGNTISFISITKLGRFKNPFATITSLPIYSVVTYKRSDFYHFSQQHKQLKTVEALSNVYEGYMH